MKFSNNDQLLLLVATKGKLEMVKYLVEEKRVNIHVNNDKLICMAALGDQVEVVKYLIKEGQTFIKELLYII